jgi:UPF0716 protein FxsA
MVIFYYLGSRVGLVPTALLILGTGLLGAWLTRREGLAVLTQVRDGMRQGAPAQTLVEGALIVAGGLLLITPGTLTDLIGFAAIIPYTRRRLAPVLIAWGAERFQLSGSFTAPPTGSPPRRPPASAPAEPLPPASSPFDHPLA